MRKLLTEPRYLMIPPLHEGGTATISWENQKDREHYELDIVFNESFDSASRGKSWSNLLGKDWEWSDQGEVFALSWEEFSNLGSQGLMWRNLNFKEISWAELQIKAEVTWRWLENQPVEFTFYNGRGEPIPASDQGLRWYDFQREQHGKWENKPDKSWLAFHEIPSVGQNWHQHISKNRSWKEMEYIATSWATFENLPTYGLRWSSLTARWLSWQERTQLGTNGLCWEEIENLPADNETHRGIAVDIPLYTKSSMLRVRGFGQSDKEPLAVANRLPYYEERATYRLNKYNTMDSSPWLESLEVPVIPVFYREDSNYFAAVSGMSYCLQLYAKEVANFKGVIMNLRYDPKILQLEQLLSETPAGKSDPWGNKIDNFREISRTSGQLQFQCVREMEKDREWSGLLLSAQFKALRTGNTNVTLS